MRGNKKAWGMKEEAWEREEEACDRERGLGYRVGIRLGRER